MSKKKGQIYEFSNFRLDAGERQLLRDGEPVALPSKAFDLLVVLIENNGRLVQKEELYQSVWADQIVEESNLTVQMSAIRKALGERKQYPRHIVTVPGYGYRFVGDVAVMADDREVVFETETLSRIVVEREETVERETEGVGGAEKTGASRPWVVVEQSSAGTSRIDSSAAAGDRSLKALPEAAGNSLRQRHVVLFLSAGLILTVIVAMGAIWLYRSGGRDRQAALRSATDGITQRRFTTHGGVPVRVAISPDGKSLVYEQRVDGKDSLWLGQIETNTSVLIHQQQDLRFNNLVFSPDGNHIYFNLEGAGYAQPMLAKMSVLGGAITELIPGLDGPVTFDPGGKQIAFRQRNAETKETSIIIAETADCRNQRSLVTCGPPETISSGTLSWSPDGRAIAYSAYNANRNEELVSVDVEDGSARKIGGRDWGSVSNLAWLPDGSGLLVLARENAGDRMRQIWLVSYPDGEARRITNDLNVFLQDTLSVSSDGRVVVLQGYINAEIWIAPKGDATQSRRLLNGVAPRYEGVDGLAWTPDGRLLYTANVGDSRVIWSINSDGSNLRQVTPNKANTSDSNMCSTADGRYVVFQSNRSGSLEIWRVNSDGTNLTQLTSGGNNFLPSLSADGESVVYLNGRSRESKLQRISIGGGTPTQISDTPCIMAEISPDSRYIACLALSPARLLLVPFAGGEPVRSFAVPETAVGGRPRIRWMPDGKSIIYKDDGHGLWRQSLDEEEPKMFKSFEEFRVRQLAWSFDGKNLACASGPTTQEIIVLENIK